MLHLKQQLIGYEKRLEKVRKEEKYLTTKVAFLEELMKDHT